MKVPLLPNGMVATARERPPKPVGKKRGPYARPRRMLITGKNRRTVPPSRTGLLDINVSIPRWKLASVNAMAKDMRKSRSKFLREAISDLLRKHGAM